jgi:hypothetical protein
VDLRPVSALFPDESFKEAKVFWVDLDGETFWCCDITLELVSRASFRKEG